MKNRSLVIAGITGVIAIGAIIGYVAINQNIQTSSPVKPEEEQQHSTMQMENIAVRSGKLRENVHDARMSMAVNSYRITSLLDGNVAPASGNSFLVADLAVRGVEHSLSLSPNLFRLKTNVGVIEPSDITSLVDAGLRKIFLPEGQTFRGFLVFESDSFGTTPSILQYSDGMSSFTMTLEESGAPQRSYPSLITSTYVTGHPMQDNSLRLTTNVSSVSEPIDDYTPKSENNEFLRVLLEFENLGESSVRVDPSYVFIIDSESYTYGISESASDALGLPLKVTDLEPGDGVVGEVIVEVPRDSTDLMFMYAGPNNSFLAKVVMSQ